MNKKQLIARVLKKGGIRLIYSALLLYYAFKRKDLPAWARSIVTVSYTHLDVYKRQVLDCVEAFLQEYAKKYLDPP